MLRSIADSLAQSSLSRFIGDLDNSVFVLQTIHILAIAALMLSTVLVALRALGIVGPALDLQRETERHARTLFASLGVLVVTGALLVMSDPQRTILTTAFQVKMVLVVAFAAVAGVMFRSRSGEAGAGAGAAPAPHRRARACSRIALPLIVSIIFLGRWIGYS